MAQRNTGAYKSRERTSELSAFQGNAARKLNTAPEREPLRKSRRQGELVRLSEKELRKARRQGLNPLRIVASLASVAVVFTLVMTMIYGQVQLTELTEKVNAAQTDLAELESMEVQLQMKAAASMDVDEIKTYAETELGMEQIKNSQVTYVNLAQQDSGAVVEETKVNIFQQLWNALVSWLS
jgi:hypothetical protein